MMSYSPLVENVRFCSVYWAIMHMGRGIQVAEVSQILRLEPRVLLPAPFPLRLSIIQRKWQRWIVSESGKPQTEGCLWLLLLSKQTKIIQNRPAWIASPHFEMQSILMKAVLFGFRIYYIPADVFWGSRPIKVSCHPSGSGCQHDPPDEGVPGAKIAKPPSKALESRARSASSSSRAASRVPKQRSVTNMYIYIHII